MPLREFTFHENWVIQNAFNRLQIRPTIPNPSWNSYLRLDNVPGKGQGYIADRNITRGTRILEESPYLQIRRSGKQLLPQHSSQINREVNRMPEASRTLFSELSPAGSINYLRFKRNSFDMSEAGNPAFYVSGIFRHASRFNHSCIPNANVTWNPEIGLDNQGRLTVHAIRDIAFGEEVVIDYQCSYKARAARMQELRNDYGFDCTCPICDTQSPVATQSELNRQWMKQIVDNHQFSSRKFISQNPTPDQKLAELTDLQTLLGVVKAEGIMFPQLADTYGWLAAWYAREVAQAGMPGTTRQELRSLGLEAAERKLDIEILCTGDRSVGVQESLDLIGRIS